MTSIIKVDEIQNNAGTTTLAKRFNEVFEYRDGQLYWKINTNKSKNLIGKLAGGPKKRAYGLVTIDSKSFLIHRVIFCMFHGYLPKQVDHIDGNPQNHRIENLRAATSSTNNMNRGAQVNNRSGIKNVCWNKTHKRWSVQIQKNKKRVYTGMFDDLELAELVAHMAREKYHGEFARG
jgi:hypothetical protein